MRLTFLFIVLLAVSFLALNAQNLVPNPGFEEFTSCPGGFSQRSGEFRVRDWRSANSGTPDHFHSCSTGEADVPHNWAGVSYAFEGEGFIGLYAWMNNDIDYREYAQCKLASPLTKDSLYVIQFHYKLSSYSKYSIDRLGILLTDTAMAWRTDRVPKNVMPTFEAKQDSALTENTGDWEKGVWQFRAKGGEQFLILGNFSDNAQTRHYLIQFRNTPEVMLAGSAYYFIDEVKVYSPYIISNEGELIPEFAADLVAMNTSYVLKNIQFEFDSYKLLATSFDELDKLAIYALKHPRISLQISGHTDDVGGDRYNTKLSRNRALSVAQYLMLQGIVSGRIEIFGYGKSRPLIKTQTEEARTTNRRVEIRFLE